MAKKRVGARYSGSIALLVGLAILGSVRPAEAQSGAGIDTDEPDVCSDLRSTASDAPDPVQLEHGGEAGMWFPMETSRLMLCEVRELRARRQEIRLVDQELDLWRKRVDLYREQLDLAVQARDVLMETVDAAERRARDAEAARDAWWRSPILWTIVGAVVGAVILVGGAYVAASVP